MSLLYLLLKLSSSLRSSRKNLCQEMGLKVHSDLKALKLSVDNLYLFPVQVLPCTFLDSCKAHSFTFIPSWEIWENKRYSLTMARARRHSHLPPRHYLPAPLTTENRDLMRRGSWNKWEYPPNFNDLILFFRTHKQLLPSGLVLFFITPEGISAYYMILKKNQNQIPPFSPTPTSSSEHRVLQNKSLLLFLQRKNYDMDEKEL